MKYWKIMDHNLRKKQRSQTSAILTFVQQMAVLLNIVKHLKMSAELKKKRNTVAYNNVCPVCSEDFAQ